MIYYQFKIVDPPFCLLKMTDPPICLLNINIDPPICLLNNIRSTDLLIKYDFLKI